MAYKEVLIKETKTFFSDDKQYTTWEHVYPKINDSLAKTQHPQEFKIKERMIMDEFDTILFDLTKTLREQYELNGLLEKSDDVEVMVDLISIFVKNMRLEQQIIKTDEDDFSDPDDIS